MLTHALVMIGLLALFVLFVIGVVLAENQRKDELNDIIGYKLVIRRRSFAGVQEWFEDTTYHGSLEACQDALNSYSKTSILSAYAEFWETRKRYVMDHNGVLMPVQEVKTRV